MLETDPAAKAAKAVTEVTRVVSRAISFAIVVIKDKPVALPSAVTAERRPVIVLVVVVSPVRRTSRFTGALSSMIGAAKEIAATQKANATTLRMLKKAIVVVRMVWKVAF